MTRTTTLTLQSVDFGKDDLLALTIFVFFFFFGGGRQNLSKSYENHNPYGVIYRVPLVGLSDLSPPRLGSLNLTKNGF